MHATIDAATTIEIDVTGEGDVTPVTYEMLLAAICLAEAGQCPAQWAVEIAARGGCWDIGVVAFGSIYPYRNAAFTPRDVEHVVALARRLTAMRPAAGAESDHTASIAPSGGVA